MEEIMKTASVPEKLSRRRQETLVAIEDIEVGRIVDGDKVMSWLAGWGMDNEMNAPLE